MKERFSVMSSRSVEVTNLTDQNPVGVDWVTIIPAGNVKSSKREFLLDQKAADAIIANHDRVGLDLPIDYEHQTLGGSFASPDGKAPAAGWMSKLRYNAGKGLQALVRWCEPAGREIIRGGYKYLSPVVVVDDETDRAVSLHSAALVNKPAISNFPPLRASTIIANCSRLILADAPADAPSGDTKPSEDTGQSVDTLIASIRDLLTLPADTAPEDVLQAVVEALKSAAAAGGGAEDAIANKATTTVVNREVLALKNRVMETESLLSTFAMQGKLTASMEETFRRKLTANAERFESAKAEFVDIMSSIPVIVPQGQVTSTRAVGSMNGSPKRLMVIHQAAREFDGEPQLQKLTNKAAYVSMKLREEGLTILTASEREGQV